MKISSVKLPTVVICLAMLAMLVTLSNNVAHKNQHNALVQSDSDLPGSYSTAVNTLYTSGR
ncbi:hypothetical protein [Pelotalea chapellei]|uniref:Uncharacterized protein n=1 Tax=Pelotalea chapellei TaxID=44671 RepID=A0ABS5UAN8_9BACT|nr:hypothetical protein [Pelotalea chapellei]MBT1072746.1 hypothetical protein [Pelotalea chapellei]